MFGFPPRARRPSMPGGTGRSRATRYRRAAVHDGYAVTLVMASARQLSFERSGRPAADGAANGRAGARPISTAVATPRSSERRFRCRDSHRAMRERARLVPDDPDVMARRNRGDSPGQISPSVPSSMCLRCGRHRARRHGAAFCSRVPGTGMSAALTLHRRRRHDRRARPDGPSRRGPRTRPSDSPRSGRCRVAGTFTRARWLRARCRSRRGRRG